MKAKLTKCIPYVLLGASILLVIFLNVSCHDHWLDSDMAAEMIFSKLLSETGHFFATPDWYYSTEFRFLYTHWIMGPLFHVFGSWHVIRAITNLVTYALMLAAYYFCMKPFKVDKGLVAATSAILILPFSETMMTHMVMGNTYMFHVIIAFLFFGLYLRISGTAKGGKKQVYSLLYILMALVCGVSGVRYLLALQCPLVLAAFFWVLGCPEFHTLRGNLKPENWKSCLQDFGRALSLKYFGYAVLGLMGSGVGYVINMLYVSKAYIFQTYDETNFIAVYQGVFLERLQNAFGSLIMLFGYIPDKGVLSLRGLISLIAFVLIGILGYLCVVSAKEEKGQRGFLLRFFWCSFLLNVFVFVFTTSTMVPRYYITTVIFVLPVICFYLEREEKFFDRLVVTVLLIGCLGLAAGKVSLSYLSVDKNADKRPVAQFLADNDYTFGYATYWNANIITELTDGKVEIGNIGDGEHLDFFKWSSPMKYYATKDHSGPVFLLLTAREVQECIGAAAINAGTEVYSDDAYTVLVFDSAEELLGRGTEKE